jgi:hypothetical protein
VVQGFPPDKERGLGDLDAFEKSLTFGFLQGGFMLRLPIRAVSGTEDESLRQTITILNREPERFNASHRKKRNWLRLPLA